MPSYETDNLNPTEDQPIPQHQCTPCQKTIKNCLYTFGFIYILFPIILVVFGSSIARELTYLNHMSLSKYTPWKNQCDVSKFIDYITEGVESDNEKERGFNLDIPSSAGHELAAWYIPAYHPLTARGFIIYAHGNAHSRCGKYRIQSYRALYKYNYNFITFDYGGFSNSTMLSEKITDDTLIRDLQDVVNYTKRNFPDQKLILWGHSLGTAVSSATLRYSSTVREETELLILEAPFESYTAMLYNEHFLAVGLNKMYGSLWRKIVDSITINNKIGYKFETGENLKQLQKMKQLPIIILHAEDDFIIPVESGERLYQAVAGFTGRNEKMTNFLKYDKSEGLGHNYIVAKKIADLQKVIDTLPKVPIN